MTQLTEHPHTVANRLVRLMAQVDESKPCNLIMNADALVVEYNDRFTGNKCYHDVARVENIS